MDYEQKYNKLVNAIKVLQETNPSDEGIQNWVNDNVPELAESEEERIRKALISFLKSPFVNENITDEKVAPWLAWLEKQGEQKPTEWSLPYEKNETAEKLIALAECLEMDGDCLFNELSGNDYGKFLRVLAKELTEVKPAWSDEDEEMCQNILECLRNGWRKLPTDILKYESWLKSLKQRYTWKPSKEQMRALHDMNLTGNISYAGQGQTLIELYNDLKKLKGE